MAIVARKLKTRDLWLISRIILHMQAEVTAAIEGAVTRGEKLDWERLGLPIVFDLLEQADSNLRRLLAGMAGFETWIAQGDDGPRELLVDADRLDDVDLTDLLDLVSQVVAQLMEDGPTFLASFSKMLAIRERTSTASKPDITGPTPTLPPLTQPATPKRRSAAA